MTQPDESFSALARYRDKVASEKKVPRRKGATPSCILHELMQAYTVECCNKVSCMCLYSARNDIVSLERGKEEARVVSE